METDIRHPRNRMGELVMQSMYKQNLITVHPLQSRPPYSNQGEPGGIECDFWFEGHEYVDVLLGDSTLQAFDTRRGLFAAFGERHLDVEYLSWKKKGIDRWRTVR